MKLILAFVQSLKETFKKKIFVFSLIFPVVFFLYAFYNPAMALYLSDYYRIDKIAHILWGLVIGIFFIIYLGKLFPKRKISIFILSLVSITILGLFKELFDIYVLSAYFSIGDMVANYMGFVFYFILQKQR